MNRSLFTGILLLAVLSANAQYELLSNPAYTKPVSVTIKGQILNADSSKTLYLKGTIDDVIELKPDKTFEYKAYTSAGPVVLYTENSRFTSIWVEKGTIELTLVEYLTPMRDSSGKNYLKIVNMSGPEHTEQLQLFARHYSDLLSHYEYLPTHEPVDSAANAFYPEIESYIATHRSSDFSGYLLQRFPFTLEKKRALFAMLDRRKINSYANIQLYLSLLEMHEKKR
jgi:hypothetical protein